MAVDKDLARFIRAALQAGRSRDEVRAALTEAGWRAEEIDDGLATWSEVRFDPPVPRPRATVSARDFFVLTLTFGVMLISAGHLIALLHGLIDVWLEPGARVRSGSMRWAIAVLIVGAPVYLWLTLRERARLAADPSLYRSAVRRWLIYLTLLVAAMVLLGDAMAVVYALLTGDLTVQFLAKAAVVGGIAGMIYAFYLGEIRRGEPA